MKYGEAKRNETISEWHIRLQESRRLAGEGRARVPTLRAVYQRRDNRRLRMLLATAMHICRRRGDPSCGLVVVVARPQKNQPATGNHGIADEVQRHI